MSEFHKRTNAAMLKYLRVANGYTQRDVAELIGRSQPEIAALETGRRRAGIRTAAKLAELFGLPITVLCPDLAVEIEALFQSSLAPHWPETWRKIWRSVTEDDRMPVSVYVDGMRWSSLSEAERAKVSDRLSELAWPLLCEAARKGFAKGGGNDEMNGQTETAPAGATAEAVGE